MTTVLLRERPGMEPLTVILTVDNFINLNRAEMRQPGTPVRPEMTRIDLSTVSWKVNRVPAGAATVSFFIDWLGVGSESPGQDFAVQLLVLDQAGEPLESIPPSQNPHTEVCTIGAAPLLVYAGSFSGIVINQG